MFPVEALERPDGSNRYSASAYQTMTTRKAPMATGNMSMVAAAMLLDRIFIARHAR
jgi:hypothetical protein